MNFAGLLARLIQSVAIRQREEFLANEVKFFEMGSSSFFFKNLLWIRSVKLKMQ
jgi:hypothetical protein